MEFKIPKTFLPQQSLVNSTSINDLLNKQKITQQQATLHSKQTLTSSKNNGFLKYSPDQSCTSETSTIATIKHLTFQQKERPKIIKSSESKKIIIPPLQHHIETRNQPPYQTQMNSLNSSTDNAEIQHDYIKLFQQDLIQNGDGIPAEITFRNPNITANEGSQQEISVKPTAFMHNKSSHAIESKKKVSIQFAPRSPKNIMVRDNEQNQLQKASSTFDFNPRGLHLQRQIKELRHQVQIFKSERNKEMQFFLNDRNSSSQHRDSLIIQNEHLKRQIQQLKDKLLIKDGKTQERQRMLLEQIAQLIKDRHRLQKKIQSILLDCSIGGENNQILGQLRYQMNIKDKKVCQLEAKNNQLVLRIQKISDQIKKITFQNCELDSIQKCADLSFFKGALDQITQYIQKPNHCNKQLEEAKLQSMRSSTKLFNEKKEPIVANTTKDFFMQQLKKISSVQFLKTSFESDGKWKQKITKDTKEEHHIPRIFIQKASELSQNKKQFISPKAKS